MPGRIEKIMPTMDLGDYLNYARSEYAAKGLGVSLRNPDELGMLMEKDLKKAGRVKDLSYGAERDKGSIMPKIVRKDEHPDILDYMIIKIKPKRSSAKVLLENNAKELIKLLSAAGAGAYRCAAYEKDDDLYLIMGAVDTEGKPFKDDILSNIESAI